MTNIETEFYNANEAFEYFYRRISKYGTTFAATRALFNVGFTMHRPAFNTIHDTKRKWNLAYAKAEWEWYLSGDPNINKKIHTDPKVYKDKEALAKMYEYYKYYYDKYKE